MVDCALRPKVERTIISAILNTLFILRRILGILYINSTKISFQNFSLTTLLPLTQQNVFRCGWQRVKNIAKAYFCATFFGRRWPSYLRLEERDEELLLRLEPELKLLRLEPELKLLRLLLDDERLEPELTLLRLLLDDERLDPELKLLRLDEDTVDERELLLRLLLDDELLTLLRVALEEVLPLLRRTFDDERDDELLLPVVALPRDEPERRVLSVRLSLRLLFRRVSPPERRSLTSPCTAPVLKLLLPRTPVELVEPGRADELPGRVTAPLLRELLVPRLPDAIWVAPRLLSRMPPPPKRSL